MPDLNALADSLEPEFRSAFYALIEVIAHSVPADQLDTWIDNRDIVSILNAFEEIVGKSVTFTAASSLTSSYTSLVTGGLRAAVGTTLRFDLISELVLERVRQDAAKLVVGVGQDSITSIRTILEANYLDGFGARAAGRIIRSVVGLLPSHAVAVGNYSNMLLERSTPEPVRSHMVETYARRLLTYRATNIARTETISAANAGQLQGWIEMANRGVLQRSRTRVVWVVTEDDRLCPWCAPMDGVTVELGELFVSTHKGFPEGKPETRGPGSARVDRDIRPDPRSQPRDFQGRWTTLRKRDVRDELDGRLVPLKRQIVVSHPPLHPQCRCDLKLTFSG